jgi:antibiotic biosynthesis monooxygenase (ABM) superfamily enzyme
VIARIWHGATLPENAEAYQSKLQPELLPGLSKVPGFRESLLLRRDGDDDVEFITIILWESLDHLIAFAGPDYQRSIVPDDRLPLLLKHEAQAQHFEVVAKIRGTP